LLKGKVEILTFDLRYQACRIKNLRIERNLLASIREAGIKEPLEGIDIKGKHILLNGFKRLRCARKLGINIVPYLSLGEDEAMGIIKFLRISNSKNLNILEEAKLVNNLKNEYQMSVTEIAELLPVTKSWVSMRIGLINQLTDKIEKLIFSGKFPAYSYMYTMRRFMRMNCVSKKEIEKFVILVAGNNLSTRDIERLAYGYFNGPPEFRKELEQGNFIWVLDCIKSLPADPDDCNEAERSMLKNLRTAIAVMGKIMQKFDNP